MQLQKAPNTTVIINNKEYLYFSGTSYLGIPLLPDFQKLVTQSVFKWGTSYGSSRNANLKLAIYQKGEQYLSNFLSTEDALTVSSGTLAGQFALRSLRKKIDCFFYMPKTHPAIITEEAKPIFENSELNTELKSIQNKSICILVDAIAALETSPFTFEFLKTISPTNTIYILLDESHSLGVLGTNGNGVSAQIPKSKNITTVVVSSLGKAFGLNGGVIAGSAEFINLVKSDPLFIGSAGMNPSFLDVFVNGKEMYQNQLKKLQENCFYVYHKLKHINEVKISENYPVFFYENEKITDYLYENEILITSFYYPSSIKKINRIVLNANHTKKQLDCLIDCIIQFKL